MQYPRCVGKARDGSPCPAPSCKAAGDTGLCWTHYNATRTPEERSQNASRPGPRTPREDFSSPRKILRWLERKAATFVEKITPQDAAALARTAVQIHDAIVRFEENSKRVFYGEGIGYAMPPPPADPKGATKAPEDTPKRKVG